jgi:hypothetical protein
MRRSRFSHAFRPLWLAILALAALPASALDLTVDLGVSDRAWYRYESEPGPRLATALSLGQAIGDLVYVSADFWSSSELGAGAAQWVLPREQDYTLTVDLFLDPLSIGVFGTVYAASTARGDLGLYLAAAIPVAGDILSLDAGLRAVTDLAGFYGELRLGPSALIPLPLPLGIAVQARAGFMAGGYGGHAYDGFTHLGIQPTVTLYVDRVVSLAVLGGYSFDLSGGLFPPYHFMGVRCIITTSTPAPEPATEQP